MIRLPLATIFLVFLLLVAPHGRAAGVPDGIAALLQTTADKGDETRFQTILTTALESWPDQRQALLTLAEGIRRDWLQDTQKSDLAEARATAAAAERAQRARGFMYYVDPALWDGTIQGGISSSSGNTSETAFNVGLSFDRTFNDVWEHALNLDVDFARRQGVTTQERYNLDYELLYNAIERGFIVNYTEIDVDRQTGFDYRVIENLGLGYKLLDSDRQTLRVEVGPGVRFNRIEASETEPAFTRTEFLGRLAGSYELQINDDIKLDDRISLIVGGQSTTLETVAGVSTRINSALSARFGFEASFDSNPPPDTANWDTITRANIVYDF
ncbi:DUF481 domain-containing protein [Yunchengibacter salinarum]|uniref:DUF481 domain-containing protein n=1 Tax=Yunchengibacter salinarum TaxID=3133399 RepID=UPI0035B66326